MKASIAWVHTILALEGLVSSLEVAFEGEKIAFTSIDDGDCGDRKRLTTSDS